jgi:hypothetical protein
LCVCVYVVCVMWCGQMRVHVGIRMRGVCMALSATRVCELTAVSRGVFARVLAPKATDGIGFRLPRFADVVAVPHVPDDSGRLHLLDGKQGHWAERDCQEDKIRKGKARESKGRQGKAREGKSMQGHASQSRLVEGGRRNFRLAMVDSIAYGGGLKTTCLCPSAVWPIRWHHKSTTASQLNN